jgi:hypothetical protein
MRSTAHSHSLKPPVHTDAAAWRTQTLAVDARRTTEDTGSAVAEAHPRTRVARGPNWKWRPRFGEAAEKHQQSTGCHSAILPPVGMGGTSLRKCCESVFT